MEEILHQLRLVVYPIINGVSYIPGGCLGFLPSTVLFPIGYFSLYRTPTQRRCSLPGFPRNFRSFKTTSNAPSWIIFDWWICGFVRVFCFFLKEFSWWKNAGTFEAKIWEKQKLYIHFLGHHSPENSRKVPLNLNAWQDRVFSYSKWSLFRGHMNVRKEITSIFCGALKSCISIVEPKTRRDKALEDCIQYRTYRNTINLYRRYNMQYAMSSVIADNII